MEEEYCDENLKYFNNKYLGKKYYPQPYSLYFLLIISFISFVLCIFAGQYSSANVIILVLILLILWTILWSVVVFIIWTRSEGMSWGLSFMASIIIVLCVVYLFI